MAAKTAKKFLASVAAVTILASALTAPYSSTAYAYEVLGETSFDYKALPWHTAESSPAKQQFELTSEGTMHIMILESEGADRERWDLQFRHRNLCFKAGHEYKVSFKVKAGREGIALHSAIQNYSGSNVYCSLFGDGKTMGNGPSMGGKWGNPLILTTEWQEVTGTFKPEIDLDYCEWSFEYAKGEQYSGKTVDGDELWFDDMSITCDDSDNIICAPESIGYVSRDNSGIVNNFISVNQLGYFSDLRKVAVLSDNKGDILHNASYIELSEKTYNFELVDSDENVVYKGTSENAVRDKDSGDKIYKLDFTKFKKPGTYYIRVGEWRSPEFRIGDDIYSETENNLLTNAANYFYQNRSGIDIESKYITSGNSAKLARSAAHVNDTAFVQKVWRDKNTSKEASSEYASSKITASGGWYDADNHGKYVVNSGIAVWTLQNMYERAVLEGSEEKFLDGSGTVAIPESGNKAPDILDEAAYEIDWMTQMIVKEDEPTWGKYAGMVYHQIQDYKWDGLAVKQWDYECDETTSPRLVKPPTFAATLNFAACAAQAARLWIQYDSERAEKYLTLAKNAYEAYELNYYEADLTATLHPDYYVTCPGEELNEMSLYAPKMQERGASVYGDYDVRDEAYWAACEIFTSARAMGDTEAEKYYKRLSEYKDALEVSTEISESGSEELKYTSFDSTNTAAAGTLTLALHPEILKDEVKEKVRSSILQAADDYIRTEEAQGYGVPYKNINSDSNSVSSLDPGFYTGDEYGSNGIVMNNAILIGYAYDMTKDFKYLDGITSAMDYILGTNPLSVSYVTGYGSYSVKNPRHNFWCSELDVEFPEAPSGVLVSGPNPGLQDPYVRGLGFVPGHRANPPQRCYADSIEAWSVNGAGLNLNASLAWVVSLMQEDHENYVYPSDNDKNEQENDKNITGDINLDGIVDMSDLTELALWLLGDKEIEGKDNADVDGNGTVDIADLARMKQYVSRVINKF